MEVMVLGTYHFAGSEADAVDSQIGDITTPERQEQVRRVVDSLVDFRPTKVAVERLRTNAAQVDSLYEAYRDGNYALEPNEDQQLGYRVADRLDLGQHATVGEALRWFNRPAILSRLHAPDIRMLEVGADSSFVGLEPTAKLYRRNLRIFANLTRVAEPGDRVLVIYGANHASYFREFIEDHPGMTFVDPLDHL